MSSRASRPTLFLLLAFFTLGMLYPLSDVVARAFLVKKTVSLELFLIMLSSEFYREVLLNSINIALLVTLVSTIVAYPLALVMSRHTLPAHRILHATLMLPLITPPFVGALGIKQILSRFGSINLILMNLGLTNEPIQFLGGGGIYGIVTLQALHLIPILYLTISASLQGAHITLEEAARVLGGSKWRVLRSIVIPLSIPGWFAGACVVFVAAFTDLGTPLVFEYRSVVPVQIFNMLSDLHENSLGYSLVVTTSLLALTLFLLSRSVVSETDVSGSARAQTARRTGELRGFYALALPLIIFCFAAVSLLPQTTCLLTALGEEWFMTVIPGSFTLNNLKSALQHPMTTHSLFVSFGLSLLASALTTLVGVSAAVTIHRSRGYGARIIETLSFLPLAIPGIVFAFGYIGAYSGTLLDNRLNPLPLLLIAYTIRRTPQMVRSAAAGLQQASVSFEEAAEVFGASPLTVKRRIVLPLIARHVLVGALLTFAFSMIEVSDSLLLAMEVQFYPVSKAMYALIGRPDGVELASALGVVVLCIMAFIFYLVEVLTNRSRARTLCKAALFIISIGSSADLRAEEYDELIAVTPHWEGIKAEFEEAFSEQHFDRTGRRVRIRWLDIGGSSDIVKYLKTQGSSAKDSMGIDLVFGGGTDAMVELSKAGILAPIVLEPDVLRRIPPEMSGIPLYSNKSDWYAAAISTFGIIINNVAAQRLNVSAPESWRDLARPEYYDLLSIADPRKSGSMHAMFEVILQSYGWDEGWRMISRIAANTRTITSTASQVGKDVASGEALVGIAIDTYAGDVIRRFGRDRVSFIMPTDFPAINGDGIAVLRGAPHKELAVGFINFVLSEVGQKIWYYRVNSPGGPKKYEIGKLPIIPELYNTGEPATVVMGNPFTFRNLRPFDADGAANRWALVNDIFGSFIVEVHDHLIRFAAEHQHKALPSVSVSEEEARTLSLNWTHDVQLRSGTVRSWSDLALRQLSPRGPAQVSVKWAPTIAIIAAFLCWFIRRLWRRLERN